MKTLFLFITSSCLFFMTTHGQTPIKNYSAEWKKADDLIKKNLPASALTEVKKIYSLAKKEKQDAQVIKALVFMIGLQSENRENNEQAAIREIEAELKTAKEPAAAILRSLLAEMYWNYYSMKRWRLYQQTNTENYKKDDIATWNATDFHKKIGELHLQAIKEEKLLQQTRLEPFDAIIVKGNVRHLRPTLFDLLVHRAINYFDNDDRNLLKPAYAFVIDQASAFDPAADFIHRKFVTKDSLSLQHKALLLYQKLIAFHLNDKKPDALIDADLARIQFVKTKSVHPDKDQLYFNAINHIARQYENLPAASQAWYLLAAYYNEKANTYQPHGDTTHRYARVKAKEICDRILLQKDSSEGKVNCYNLLQAIQKPELKFEIEQVNVPGQPFRSLISYKNFTALYFRIIRADDNIRNFSGDNQKYWSMLLGAAPVRSWQQSLPATNDYQPHKAEIRIDALPIGEYVLIGSVSKDFTGKKITAGSQMFYVSDISFVNNGNDYFVVHRETGQPFNNASVQAWQKKYDYKTSKYQNEKTGSYKTDKNGYFKINVPKDQPRWNYNFLLDISTGTDRLFINEPENSYYPYSEERNEKKPVTHTFFFTDRSIYRPGQTLYFKGIVLLNNDKEKTNNVQAGFTTKVYLRDANWQQVDSITVTTNDYGSFSGKFQLPATGLTGMFNIYTKEDNGTAFFHIEEYKRPKFYADYEPVKGTYKLNDKIKVTGFAKAYAGNNIDGAMVKYRVVRQPRFLYPWLFSRWWQPPTAEMEVVNGEVKTDNEGKFTIEFTAIPDLSIDKKLEPVFDYRVYADVTDINGETRSAEKNITVGYKALLLKTNIPEVLPVDSLKSLSVRTENMNGEFEKSTVQVRITRIQPDQRLIRERYWDRPDQFVLSKSEYIKAFPYDEYDNETDKTNWTKAEEVFKKTDSSRVNGEWSMGNGKLSPGNYRIEIETKDKNGETVKDVRYIELYDEKNNQLTTPQYIWKSGSQPIEPGETTSVKLGTSADNLFVIQKTDKSPATNDYSFVQLNNEKKVFPFAASEADRGGYGVSWAFVKHNRFYHYSETIKVPWTNKDLTIEYATYRDKTLPGSEEKWKVKISGYKKEKVAAEMLGSMYDASLDQFYPHQWTKPAVWPSYFNRDTWSGRQNFLKIASESKYTDYDYLPGPQKDYDWLLNIDYVDNNPKLMRLAKPVFKTESEASQAMAAGAILPDADGDGITDQFDAQPTVANEKAEEQKSEEVQVRKNFNETAFFLPDLHTDAEGNIEFSFTLPEALTKWKFQALKHTRDAAFGYSSKEIVTQKELMLQPNAPRFFREGDKIEFSTKLVNLSDKEMTGQVYLQLFDAATNQNIDGWFRNAFPNQFFTVAAGQSEVVKFPVEVPYQFNGALNWRLVAQSGNFSDGEENAMPVLTNRMLVTETLPLWLNGNGTKSFTFDKLLQAKNSESLQHQSLTIEYTSNPAWYAVQALPYLMEYPYDCAEQTWNRYYANSLASFIANASPRIKQIFETWKTLDTAALLSNLQKNQELKSILLEETPWVLQAKSEAEQKQNIALLFDMVKMATQLNASYEKLKQTQSPNGGFVWFKGGPDDRYMTQYIVTGIGHLKKLNAWAAGQDDRLNAILKTAIPYLDRKLKEDYDELVKLKTNLETYQPGFTTIQYLYMRSFFPAEKIPAASQKAFTYFMKQVKKTWTKQNKYMQGMIALAVYRDGDSKTAGAVLQSLKETSILSEELGRYWKDAVRSWWWYEAPIERQALLIEAFNEITKDVTTVNELRTWLLKNKQTNNWETTKATAEACYSLLLQGTNWLNNEPVADIKLGNKVFNTANSPAEAGTGYFKQAIDGKDVKENMANISVTVTPTPGNTQAQPGWGAVYWQYFEDLDKITTAATPLKLVKKLFIEKNTDRGPVLTPVNDGDIIKIGDKIKVRVELRVDRDMEYVHMKDMRAAALEPVNVLSSYKWQGGLGYYEATRDASTNFFFNHLRKGTYVFEYALFATHAGNFSNGVTTIQCMYAPEFTAHSEGVRINIE